MIAEHAGHRRYSARLQWRGDHLVARRPSGTRGSQQADEQRLVWVRLRWRRRARAGRRSRVPVIYVD